MFVNNVVNSFDFRSDKMTSGWGGFWAQSVEILVFPSLIGYMLSSCNFSLGHWNMFSKFLKNVG
jgi:hypothetical protein